MRFISRRPLELGRWAMALALILVMFLYAALIVIWVLTLAPDINGYYIH